ncbi:hypothetical protein niasHS_004524 [Heterodera schachtii]|uniref:Uncharacterized protein n=1 Tax=Heterodera schachtii TaxID=97005 RepID=A0ABD2JN11_HETSC
MRARIASHWGKADGGWEKVLQRQPQRRSAAVASAADSQSAFPSLGPAREVHVVEEEPVLPLPRSPPPIAHPNKHRLLLLWEMKKVKASRGGTLPPPRDLELGMEHIGGGGGWGPERAWDGDEEGRG